MLTFEAGYYCSGESVPQFLYFSRMKFTTKWGRGSSTIEKIIFIGDMSGSIHFQN